MTAYHAYLLLHAGGAVVWVGSAVTMAILGTRAGLARDPARGIAFARDSEWLGLRLYLPANLVVLASAFLLVEEGGWEYGRLWIVLALVVFAVSFLIGALVFAPGWAGVCRRADAGATGLSATIRRLVLVGWVDAALLSGVVCDMVLKPTAGDEAALAVVAAVPLVVALGGLSVLRAARVPETPAATV